MILVVTSKRSHSRRWSTIYQCRFWFIRSPHLVTFHYISFDDLFDFPRIQTFFCFGHFFWRAKVFLTFLFGGLSNFPWWVQKTYFGIIHMTMYEGQIWHNSIGFKKITLLVNDRCTIRLIEKGGGNVSFILFKYLKSLWRDKMINFFIKTCSMKLIMWWTHMSIQET